MIIPSLESDARTSYNDWACSATGNSAPAPPFLCPFSVDEAQNIMDWKYSLIDWKYSLIDWTYSLIDRKYSLIVRKYSLIDWN